MVRQEGEIRRSPEERTSAFFQQKAGELTRQLLQGDGMVIAMEGTNKRVRIVRAQAYPEVGKRYTRIKDMNPGDLFSPAIRGGIRQSLIVTPKEVEEGEGACVRLLRANYLDNSSNTFVPEVAEEGQNFAGREGDIASYFNLQRGKRSQLKFLDDSDTLYIVSGAYDITGPGNQGISAEEANRELGRVSEGRIV